MPDRDERLDRIRRYVWTDDDVSFLHFTARNVVNGSQHHVKVDLQLARGADTLPGDDEPGAAR